MTARTPAVTLAIATHLEIYSKDQLVPIAHWFRKRNQYIEAEGLANEVMQKLHAYVLQHSEQVFSEDRVSALRQILCKQILGREIRRRNTKKRSGDLRDKATLSRSIELDLLATRGYPNDCQSKVDFDDWLEFLCGTLTNRERRIVEWKLEGWTLREIASKLSLSNATIDRCIEKIKLIIEIRMKNGTGLGETRDQRPDNGARIFFKKHEAKIGPLALLLVEQNSKRFAVTRAFCSRLHWAPLN